MKMPNIRLSAEKKALIKKFFLFFFAALGVGLSLVILVLVLSLRSWLGGSRGESSPPESMVLFLDFSRPIVEKPRDFSFSLSALLDDEKETALYTIVRAIEEAKDDPRLKGIVARFDSATPPALFQVQEIAPALRSFRESGKPTYSFATSYGSFSKGGALYALASQFQHIWLQPVGSVGLTGLGVETPFAKTALEKIGVQANFMRREEYKSVMENVSRDGFSETVRSNMQSMMASLRAQLVREISQGLNLKSPQAEKLLAEGPYTASEALRAKLVSKLGYQDEVAEEIKQKAGKDVHLIDPGTYLYYIAKEKKAKPKASVAFIHAEGLITDQPSRGTRRMAKRDVIDTEALVDAFAKAADDPDIKAVLFRVSSPGGSPAASETIRRALLRVKKEGKPVIVSMGQVAASGGYWISMDADRIIADPATVTGSIGVVAGKFVLGGLYDKLGVKWENLETDGNAGLWSTRRTFGPREQERINALLDETYGAFLTNVSAARKIPMTKMPSVAKGRVFTGEQALKAGLVDELGGMKAAIAAVKKGLKLEQTDKIALVLLPEPETASTFVLRLLQNLDLGAFLFPGFFARLEKLEAAFGPLLDEMEESGAVRAVLPAFYLKTGW